MILNACQYKFNNFGSIPEGLEERIAALEELAPNSFTVSVFNIGSFEREITGGEINSFSGELQTAQLGTLANPSANAIFLMYNSVRVTVPQATTETSFSIKVYFSSLNFKAKFALTNAGILYTNGTNHIRMTTRTVSAQGDFILYNFIHLGGSLAVDLHISTWGIGAFKN